ncbi:mechanosensitive ion channel family protein [Aquibacillus salsiterrae]|uniref:Mechanosensitive ion channel n=1 Tax=Aquibacillus salsiterrae TaxID=2950439 RepID=A0A9X3WGD8_9BACI|nr:mechanosensitive ion channel domain-containing protein [Aquibacillus salsiterrae]MDC3416959.1 mechanosensitive ion channel [Aquibacillus salsiterrae]
MNTYLYLTMFTNFTRELYYQGLPFLFFLGLILLGRWLVLSFFKRISNRGKSFFSENETPIRYFINWITTYGILVFILFYFSSSTWMFQEITSVGKVKISAFLIIIAILIISFANRASKMITKHLLPRAYQRYQLDRGVQFTFNRIFHYTVMIVAFVVSLTTVGIDLSALTVFAGVIGVGIGFGMQNITSNFISGIILLFERPIKVGDRVIVNGIIGDIEKINMRATIIRTIDNEHIIVPNSYFLEEHVVNRSYSDPTLRLRIPIGVAYGSDVEKVRELLLQVARDEMKASDVVLADPEPFVHFKAFGASSLDFELFIWISSPNHVIATKSSINFRINKILKEHNIEIPFPQLDLHIKS